MANDSFTNARPGDNDGTAPEAPDRSIKVFTMLENNPEVMNNLAYRLGLSKQLSFHDVYSLYDSDMLDMLPRPVLALLVTVPMSEAWKQDRDSEDAPLPWYDGAGQEEPVIWFQQTIIHGCGLIGLLHCIFNSVSSEMIVPRSELANLLEKAVPLGMHERAKLLNDTEKLFEENEAVARTGDSQPIDCDEFTATGNHFVAFVKGRDGHLWELEGSRKGPLDRGPLGEGDDAISDRALELGIKRLIDMRREGSGDLMFSCIALAPNVE
ncbi:hypothetical protein UA08_07512 [Talaromyces atroroseus]|uniref:Ubiquitin carboxyl-terminal hydrolase n=1 Tax=Talaromyces atroroseus TaxID=1441469 RepID=A0A225A9A6_TALAT|nr:hypothetical protein UA08_07512 [Talaromyces atroroseus]OKL57292.1 hypothetical protein UA08_07512 [Talaromyces atroroseus]